MRPNIFDIATKELHQDAFITWLLQFADNEHRSVDGTLNECGRKFIQQLIRKRLPDFTDSVEKVKAGRQWQDIDVWAKINDKYLVIIEDKIHSSAHSDQLRRYKEMADTWCSKNGYEKPICIYLKTGNESLNSLKGVIRKGYAIFDRIDFIDLLEEFSSTQNNIFHDFLARLKRLERQNLAFENKNIGEWKGADWQGFFQFLEKEINIINWHYVNNPNGGFWNAVLNWEYWGVYPVYIQIEQGKLCFKISTDPDEVIMPDNATRSGVRNQLNRLILSKAKELGFTKIKRPKRFGHGKYMTVAVVERKNWLGSDLEVLNSAFVIDSLNAHKQFLKQVIA